MQTLKYLVQALDFLYLCHSSRLPYGGFGQLTGGGGPQKFSISLVPYVQNLLPTASTWLASFLFY